MEMEIVTSASGDLKSALRKNPFYLALFTLMSFLALFGLLVLVLLGWSYMRIAPFDDEAAFEEDSEFDYAAEPEEEAIPAPSVAYGKIVEIKGPELTLEVDLEEGVTESFLFTLTANTTYTHFAYANDDDLEGTETPITHGDLQVGDTVALYVEGEIVRELPNETVRVVKTNE